MSLDVANELILLASKVKELAAKNRVEIRRSADNAEELNHNYEKALEREAKTKAESEDLHHKYVGLRRESARLKGLAQARETENTRLRRIVADQH